MSSFYGKTIIFNDIPSEVYGLRIFDFNPLNPNTSNGGGDVSISEEWLYRREVPYFYGRYYQSPLEFDITLGSYSYIDGDTRNAIQSWLLGKNTYLPLRIVQDDISGVVFNAILTKGDPIYVGNLSYAITVHARCDRPWGTYTPPVVTKTYASGSALDTFDYINSSVYSGYNKPTITFTMSGSIVGSSGSFVIINNTDSGRRFGFTGLVANETIVVDNDKGIITSSGSSLRMANFNKNFFRLIQGVNNITISGSPSNVSIASVFAKGVGV